jgi:hypothetical protein
LATFRKVARQMSFCFSRSTGINMLSSQRGSLARVSSSTFTTVVPPSSAALNVSGPAKG